MRRPFDKTFPVTQIFNDERYRSSYFKFGLKGHNGYYYGLPHGTSVLAPHSGKVLEAGLDPQVYGNYVKIDNGIEGSVLAHLSKILVVVGQEVKERDLIGYSGNTGNSTAAHLHWGYYRNPRDRANGFNGYIDQDEYLKNAPSPEIEDDWKKSAYDRALTLLKQLKLLDNNDSNKYQDNEGAVFVGVRRLIDDNEAHHRGYEEFKAKYANAEKDLLLKDNEIKHIKEQADNDCDKKLADERVSLLNEHASEVEQWKRKIDELNQILKDGVKTEKIPVETPLADRFREKTFKDRLLAILEIVFAK